MSHPLMPRATAVWMVDNTTLTFDQIADFCGLHPLEVQGIADGEVAVGIVGRDPVGNAELTQEDIEAGQNDAASRLKVREREIVVQARRKGPRYTPVSKRQNRPNAIAWLVKYHPELTDAQVCKLVGTTKPTVTSVRDRTHWNTPNLKLEDPVMLGMCTQTELEEAIRTALRKQRRREEREAKAAAKAKRAKDALAAEAAGGDAVVVDAPVAEPEPAPVAPPAAPLVAPAGYSPPPIEEIRPNRVPDAAEVFGAPTEPEGPKEEDAVPDASKVFGARPEATEAAPEGGDESAAATAPNSDSSSTE